MLLLTSPLFLFKRNSTLLPGPAVIVWDRLESPLVNILFTTKLLSPDPLSWGMDCLLTLWSSSSLLPLVTVTVRLVFWSLSLTKETSCTTAYIYSEKSLKKLCSIRAWVPVSFFLSLSLSLWLIPWSTETHLAHSPARASKTLSRRCPGPSPPFERVPGAFVRDASPVTRALLVLCVNQGVSASLFYFLIVASGPPGPGPLKDPNNYLCKLVETMIEKSPAPTSGPKLKEWETELHNLLNSHLSQQED